MGLGELMPSYRSWSQLSDWEKCPEAYRLKRVEKVWSRPAAWLPFGTAVHHGIEGWEKSGRTMDVAQAVDLAEVKYRDEVNRYLTESPNAETWFASGQYRGPEDIVRRQAKIKEHVWAYTRYHEDPKHEGKPIYVDTGVETEDPVNPTLAVELPFNVKIGDVQVRGFIDKVEQVQVVDVKTGSSSPGDGSQLKVYQLALRDQYGIEVPKGSYFLTAKGRPGRVKDLSKISEQALVDRFGALEEGVKAEAFDPKPGDHCVRCDVNESCPIFQSLI